MNIWVVRISEPLPFVEGVRLWRAGILSQALVDQGHRVTWWQSTYDHQKKAHTTNEAQTVHMEAGYKIRLLHGPSYPSNISVQRLVNYGTIGWKFAKEIKNEEPPDLIHASMPTIEMAHVAVQFANKHRIPIVVEIRDLWPDLFVKPFPTLLHPLAHLPLRPYTRRLKELINGATALTAVSREYLDWGLAKRNRPEDDWDRVFYLAYQRRSLSKDVEAKETRKLRDLGVDTEKIVCCFFGIFGFSTDLDLVLNAAEYLQQSGDTRFQFVICGRGDKMKELTKRAKKLNNVIFPGWVSVETVTALMKLSSIGLVAYTQLATQSLPNKPFEYFSQDLPILSSLEGEMQDLIQEHHLGVHYQAGNMGSFLAGLDRLALERKAETITKAQIRRVFDRLFSADVVYKDYINYLENLAENTKL